MYNVIDLFAGAGGLSLGFKQTNKFDIKFAAENNPNARLTYNENHPETELKGDVREIDYKNFEEKYGNIDVVIGGPPCQGFSNANRQKNHVISMNNSLVKEYVRAVINLKPKVFVMENVGMLRSDVHRFYNSKIDKKLVERLEIPMTDSVLELLPKGMHVENIEAIIGDKNKLESYLWSEDRYLLFNILYKHKNRNKKDKIDQFFEKHGNKLEKYCDEILVNGDSNDKIAHSDYRMASIIKKCISKELDSVHILHEEMKYSISIQRMLSRIQELNENLIDVDFDDYDITDGVSVTVKSYAVLDYVKNVLQAAPYNYVLKPALVNAADYGAPQKRMRFIIIGCRSEYKDKLDIPKIRFTPENYRTVRDAIKDLEDIPPELTISAEPIIRKKEYKGILECLRDSDSICNHVATASRETARKRFAVLKQGQNFHNLAEELKDTYADASRTQNTIYMRLNYDEPSGTVVNVRKSMWIHPIKNRALSIREAARLQTFPDSFIFQGTKDSQYQQVGNAVPPILANAIAEKVLDILEGNE